MHYYQSIRLVCVENYWMMPYHNNSPTAPLQAHIIKTPACHYLLSS